MNNIHKYCVNLYNIQHDIKLHINLLQDGFKIQVWEIKICNINFNILNTWLFFLSDDDYKIQDNNIYIKKYIIKNRN